MFGSPQPQRTMLSGAARRSHRPDVFLQEAGNAELMVARIDNVHRRLQFAVRHANDDGLLWTYNRCGEFPDRTMLEQLSHTEIEVKCLVDAVDDTNRRERMAAQVEEIILHADLLDTQDTGPNIGNSYFNVRTRRNIGKIDACHIMLDDRQRLSVQLAAWASTGMNRAS